MTSKFTIDLSLDDRRVAFDMRQLDNDPISSAVQEQLEKYKCCEPEVVHLMMRAIRPGDIAIDGGANIGFFTLLMSKLVGSTGLVIAYEPGIENVARLKENLELNQIANVDVRQNALWNAEVVVDLQIDRDGGNNSLGTVKNIVSIERHDAVALNSIGLAPRFIKLDIEGAEIRALYGASEHLKHTTCPFVVCELNEPALKALDGSQTELRGWMRLYGYKTFLLHKDGTYPSQLPERVNILPTYLNSNILFSTPEKVADIWATTSVP